MPGFKKLVLHLTVAGAVSALAAVEARAQWGWATQQQPPAPGNAQTPPPQGVSRGENFSAGKTPAQLFASDCTGAGCHRGPQGLAKDRGQLGLTSFLREHYTNSRESASILAGYLAGVPAGPAKPADKPPRAAARTDETAKPPKPATAEPPGDIAVPEKPAAKPAAKPEAKPPRGRQATTAAPAALAAPAAAPAPEPPPPAPPAPPPAPQWDIFD